MKKSPAKQSAENVRAALRKRFAAPAWAILDEVGNATGARCNRHADMVAVSLWPSRGLEIHGIEIKVSRTDWLKELGDPAKADEIQRYCHRWWIAAGDDTIVRAGELPPTWGLLVVNGKRGTVAKTEAPKLAPEAPTMSFVAALLRRASEQREALRSQGYSEGYEKGLVSAPKEGQDDIDRLERELKQLREAVTSFETASGLKLSNRWEAGDVGSTVKRFREITGRWHPGVDPKKEIEEAAERLEQTAARLRSGAAFEQQLAELVNELDPQQVEALRGVA